MRCFGLSKIQFSPPRGGATGKSTSYTSKGKKTIVRPEIVENPYNGKMYYQWKTERGNKNG